jgi:NAD(P)-dependent dehydrogenase (short-subunit alcohol dehydrogenase family)
MTGQGRIALVTGAGSGIGRAAAAALLKEGYKTVLTGRRRDALDETAKLAAGASGEALVHPADLTKPADVDALFAAIKAKYGRLDVLFNNAGVNAPGVLLEDLAFEDWKNVVDVNLTAMFLCMQGAFRLMKAQNPQGGRIINNGSISAQAPRPNSVAYTSTKHAVTGLTKSGALDGRKYGIAVGQIDIGNAASNMTAAMTKGVPQANGTLAPEPVMDVQNVAKAVVYMASLPPEANVLTMTVMATTMPLVGRG